MVQLTVSAIGKGAILRFLTVLLVFDVCNCGAFGVF